MATVFFIIVVLHFVAAFVWLGIKLSPKAGDPSKEDASEGGDSLTE